MKATGIVRRIDDLGRVVIPKEIRRTMRIREGDPLEIYTDREGEVIFKKYSPIGEMTGLAATCAETLHKTCEMTVAICDRDSVIACSGLPRRDYADRSVSGEVERLMQGRALYQHKSGDRKFSLTSEHGEYYVSCAMPIITEGDVTGCVMSAVRDERDRLSPELEQKLVKTAAGFLGKQLEG